ncbi:MULTISPECIES: hypothetical protein [unclassified Streptomyces]|uniref:hypothetical protein n=1 Tax=unclassified Streptomyces TaxID=2593676 RepID=UPI002E103850|nr:hypothetical protein OG452_23675 [Streptomyces sp. NBC_01197]WSS49229.1 hypothetical protein OG708_11625 [Streptomyces sp. NBC_01180]
MNRDTSLCGETSSPLSPRSLCHSAGVHSRVLSAPQLREHGVTAARAAAQCRPGGPWQQLLPGVFVLHPGPPTGEERVHAALLYAGRPPAERSGKVPSQPRRGAGQGAPVQDASLHDAPVQGASPAGPVQYGNTMVTGLAALALHRFSAAPPLLSVDRIDVLVPRTRRLRSTGCARIVRAHTLPGAQRIDGVPVAPVERALADAVAELSDADAVRRLLTEAVRGGHCEPAALVRELTLARLLSREQVSDAVDSLLAEGRSLAEDRLYGLVRDHALPGPLWNVELRLPGGPSLGGVDAYWPDEAVAVELDTRAAPRARSGHRTGGAADCDGDVLGSPYARKRDHLERLGITVVHLTPAKLRDAPAQQATVVRTALMAAEDRAPAARVVVLPR